MIDALVIDVGDERRLSIAAPHVREVAAAGWVTPVPTAPSPVVGVMQLRGQIVPVLDLVTPPRPVHPDDPVLILEYGPAAAALRIVRVLAPGAEAGASVERLDVAALFDAVRGQGG